MSESWMFELRARLSLLGSVCSTQSVRLCVLDSVRSAVELRVSVLGLVGLKRMRWPT
jgi:hypothetical protein